VQAVGVGLAHGDVDGEDRLRGVEAEAPRPEDVAVVADRGRGAAGVDEPGEGVADAEGGGELGAARARAEQPRLGPVGDAGHERVVVEGVVLGERLVQPGQGLEDLLPVVRLGGVLTVLLQGGVEHRPGGGASHAEVDAAGRHGLELLVGLGHREGAAVVHEHGAGADPDGRGEGGDGGDEQLGVVGGARAGEVVFGEPRAVVAESLGVAGGGDGVGQRVRLGGTGCDRGQVDDGQSHGRSSWSVVLGAAGMVCGAVVCGAVTCGAAQAGSDTWWPTSHTLRQVLGLFKLVFRSSGPVC